MEERRIYEIVTVNNKDKKRNGERKVKGKCWNRMDGVVSKVGSGKERNIENMR